MCFFCLFDGIIKKAEPLWFATPLKLCLFFGNSYQFFVMNQNIMADKMMLNIAVPEMLVSLLNHPIIEVMTLSAIHITKTRQTLSKLSLFLKYIVAKAYDKAVKIGSTIKPKSIFAPQNNAVHKPARTKKDIAPMTAGNIFSSSPCLSGGCCFWGL